jgi:hypothetical protein
MSIAEYHSATQLGIFPFYHWTYVVWTICMNYLYELFVFELPTHLCTASIIVFGVVFLCITINHWSWVLFNTNLCQHHAKIFIYSKPGGLFICSGINSLYRGINSLYRGIPLHTIWTSGFKRFWFQIWIRAVYRGIPRHQPLPLPSGKNATVGKKTLLAVSCHRATSPTTGMGGPFSLSRSRWRSRARHGCVPKDSDFSPQIHTTPTVLVHFAAK